MSLTKSQPKKGKRDLSARAQKAVNNALETFAGPSGFSSGNSLAARILLDYFADEDNYISCPQAGPDIWLKSIESFTDFKKFRCKNGNSFLWHAGLNQVTKAYINGEEVNIFRENSDRRAREAANRN